MWARCWRMATRSHVSIRTPTFTVCAKPGQSAEMPHFGIYAEALSAIVLTLALLLRMQRGSGNEGDQGVTATRGNTKLGALRSQTAISPNIVPP